MTVLLFSEWSATDMIARYVIGDEGDTTSSTHTTQFVGEYSDDKAAKSAARADFGDDNERSDWALVIS